MREGSRGRSGRLSMLQLRCSCCGGLHPGCRYPLLVLLHRLRFRELLLRGGCYVSSLRCRLLLRLLALPLRRHRSFAVVIIIMRMTLVSMGWRITRPGTAVGCCSRCSSCQSPRIQAEATRTTPSS